MVVSRPSGQVTLMVQVMPSCSTASTDADAGYRAGLVYPEWDFQVTAETQAKKLACCDIDPAVYGEPRHPTVDLISAARAEFDFAVLQAAFNIDYANDQTSRELERIATDAGKWGELLNEYNGLVQQIETLECVFFVR